MLDVFRWPDCRWWFVFPIDGAPSTWWLIPLLVSGLVHPNYKWVNPTYPIYNWGYNPLTKWDEPPSRYTACDFQSVGIWADELLIQPINNVPVSSCFSRQWLLNNCLMGPPSLPWLKGLRSRPSRMCVVSERGKKVSLKSDKFSLQT